MTIDVTVAIDLNALRKDQTPYSVAEQLGQLGGTLVGWSPATVTDLVKATYRFETEAERDEFLAAAIRLPPLRVAPKETTSAAGEPPNGPKRLKEAGK